MKNTQCKGGGNGCYQTVILCLFSIIMLILFPISVKADDNPYNLNYITRKYDQMYNVSGYVKWSNAVYYNGEKYDLIITSKGGKISSWGIQHTSAGTSYHTLQVTKHVDGSAIGEPIEFSGVLGFGDLDTSEAIALPDDLFEETHRGSWVRYNYQHSYNNDVGSFYTSYRGVYITNGSDVQDNNYTAVWGKVRIPKEGIAFYYYTPESRGMYLGFDDMINQYIQLNPPKTITYEVTRGRAGTGTAALIKNGGTNDYLPILSLKGGDTTEIIPDEKGTCSIFKEEKNINVAREIFDDISGGLTATLGGGTTNILGYTDPDKNHLDFKTSDGKDAFIEFCKTTIELKEADNVQDGIKPSIVPAIRLDYNNGEDPDWHNDLVFYTDDAQELSIPEDEDFIGWNTKYNGKGDWYGSEERNGIRTAKKVNITIQDADDISESQNTNIGVLYAIYVKESYFHSNH